VNRKDAVNLFIVFILSENPGGGCPREIGRINPNKDILLRTDYIIFINSIPYAIYIGDISPFC
jgi:hypothetical protein